MCPVTPVPFFPLFDQSAFILQASPSPLMTPSLQLCQTTPLKGPIQPSQLKDTPKRRKISFPCFSLMMQRSWVFLVLLFVHAAFPKASSDIGIGGGVGVWVNGRGINLSPESASSSPPASTNIGSISNSKEYTALQAWKLAITEDPNHILSSWVGPNVCTYKGIFCSEPPVEENSSTGSSSSVISGIDLNHGNLKGILVKELSMLSQLSIIHLNSNRFSGVVPDSFAELQYLTELDLSNNQFSGLFPSSTLLIPNLVYLDLRFNSFSGEIPEEVFEKDLDAIFLNSNQFEGQIPMNLWASPASVITLANNKLSGTIPTNFAYMDSGIKEVLFLKNKLTGCIPEGVGYLSDIEVLDLSFNSLAGHLPSSLSCLSGLEVLNIGHNQLSGELPDLVCDLKRLINLTVAYNFFSAFSQDCGKLNVGFDFSGNCIPGRNLQRPTPECTGIPGVGLSCLRIPSPQGLVCSVTGGLVNGVSGLPITLGSSEPSSSSSLP